MLNVLPSGEYNTKINLMAASGGEDFTDVVLAKFSDGMVQNLADNEVAIAITEYMYNTDIAWNMMEAKERLGWDFYPYITMPDGEIYAIPRINDSISNPYSDRMFVYKPWFDAAGIDVDSIKTMEGLKNLNTYVNEMISKYVTGIEDIDGDWDNFQNQLELMNIDEILECAQAAYDRIQAVTD